ncbi:MAG TPA: FAD:protein FMN transferase [Cellvibrio sp.]|nr:FAD:protein FMN transferase [Cellvibrio sp.]
MRTLLAGLVLLMSLPAAAGWHSDTQDIMGTVVSVTLWLDDDIKGEQAVAAVMAEMRRIDQQYSPFIATSELSRVNELAPRASAQHPLNISAEMASILQKAEHYSRLSSGAFDITFASLARYYDYRKGLKPSDAQFKELLPQINYTYIHLDSKANTVYFDHPKVYIDLGGIAKGFAVDRGADILQKFGVVHANISAGGDSRVMGDKLGKPWLVGIRNPRAQDKNAVAITLPLENCAISTSGDYERFFIDKDGQRVHHIINPRTGKSAQGIISVSVIGPLGFDTDPLTKTIFILGAEKGLALINSLPGFDAVVINDSGKVLYSQGLTPP